MRSKFWVNSKKSKVANFVDFQTVTFDFQKAVYNQIIN